jgi:ornithine cyclodeaminase
MMQLVHRIGLEPMLTGLADVIEADFRRWEHFDKTPASPRIRPRA